MSGKREIQVMRWEREGGREDENQLEEETEKREKKRIRGERRER